MERWSNGSTGSPKIDLTADAGFERVVSNDSAASGVPKSYTMQVRNNDGSILGLVHQACGLGVGIEA